MEFASKYKNRMYGIPEAGGGETMVEIAGYRSAQQRIEDLIMSGQRLVQSRVDQFDFQDGREVPGFVDPTRSPGFDLADAAILRDQAETNMRNSKQDKEIRDKEAAEAAEEAKKASEKIPASPDK